MQWYYIDIEGQQHGPIISKLLVHKLKEGDLDGLSLVYGGDSTTEWRKVSEVQVLKNELAKIAIEEENMRLAFLKTENENEIEKQVFVEDFDPSKAFPIPKEMLERSATSTAAAASSAPTEESGDQKVYIADNGQRYVWDDEEDDWVEEDASEAIASASTSQTAVSAAITGNNKRKGPPGKSSENKNPDDDSEEEGEDNGVEGDKTEVLKPKKKRSKKKAKKGPNTWVYITGLPPDITVQELKDHFSKVSNTSKSLPFCYLSESRCIV